MPILVNIHKLQDEPLSLAGEILLEELDFVSGDEMITCSQPLRYQLEIRHLGDSILAQGEISLTIDCECVRCLTRFHPEIGIRQWALHLELEGDESAPIKNDCVDLTPYLREDTLLRLPQHPVCRPDCNKLPPSTLKVASNDELPDDTERPAATWNELDKLKLE
ncbi:MAG: uncharacterized metal-binding protein YceD (DUF177 family) [Limisphaerales bacterium]|jgi:uncharacterized metal-binding protein YceD (DUF177 family)